MFQNIGEYILSDIHFQLWLAAAVNSGKYTSSPQTAVAGDTRRTISCTADMWHPLLVDQFPSTDEIPDRIVCTGVTHHINGRGQFHNGKRSSPTISIENMVIEWGDLNFNREIYDDGTGVLVKDDRGGEIEVRERKIIYLNSWTR